MSLYSFWRILPALEYITLLNVFGPTEGYRVLVLLHLVLLSWVVAVPL